MPKTIRQSVTIKATPRAVYDTLIDSRRHMALTGSPARIVARPGGTFTAYGGYISGVNLQLVQGKKIVQFWWSKGWPEHYYSTVTFTLARVKDGTRLRFTQEGVPDDDYEDKRTGWITHYWQPLKAKLEK